MKKWLFVSLILGISTSSVSAATPPAEHTVAFVSKVILDVTRKVEGKDWSKATRGEILTSGDRVRTGDKSLAVIKFKDNSLVRVREKSELVVTGEVKDNAFSKSVDLKNGAVGFNIKTQKADE
ncbi:MAG: FecR domain-containing protein, partial [Ignavibacteriae bacterium]|nr:FecR domain-containing protein [Ignavibacteriota bacterium]